MKLRNRRPTAGHVAHGIRLCQRGHGRVQLQVRTGEFSTPNPGGPEPVTATSQYVVEVPPNAVAAAIDRIKEYAEQRGVTWQHPAVCVTRDLDPTARGAADGAAAAYGWEVTSVPTAARDLDPAQL